MFNYAVIPIITVICYVVISAIKATAVEKKWYPLISCGIGVAIAVAMFYIVPEFIGAQSLSVAIVSGAASGLAATGTNQIFKQLMKAAENGEDITKIGLPGFSETETNPEREAANAPASNHANGENAPKQ